MIEGVGCDISIRTNAAWQTGGGQNIEFVEFNSSPWDCKEFRALESGLARHEHPAWALLKVVGVNRMIGSKVARGVMASGR